MSTSPNSFPASYKDQLFQNYAHAIASQITDNWSYAPAPGQPNEKIPYVVVEPAESDAERKLLYVPGFGEGIVNKASTAAEAATQGMAMILPGQNRKGILRDPGTGKRSGIYTQAANTLAVLEAATEADEPVDVVTHSFGLPVLASMVQAAPNRFKESHVFALAAAGSIDGDKLPSLAKRWFAYAKSQSNQERPMEFPDTKNVTGSTSVRVLASNPIRTALEIKDISGPCLPYTQLARAVGSLTAFSYAEDRMYPSDLVAPLIAKTMKELDTSSERVDFAWATPVSIDRVLSGEMTYAGEGATHDDEQFNPSRVISAIRQLRLLKSA